MPSPYPALVSISALNKTLTICLGSIDKKLYSHLVDFWMLRGWVSLGESVNRRKFVTKNIFSDKVE